MNTQTPERTEIDRTTLLKLLSKVNHDPHPTRISGTRHTRDVVPFSNPHSKLYDEFDQRFPVVRGQDGVKSRSRSDRGNKGETDSFYFGEQLAYKTRVSQTVTVTSTGDVKFDTYFYYNDRKIPTIDLE